MPMPEAVLLDTHAWIWFAIGEHGRVKPATIARIQLAGRDGQLFLANISLWETAMLAAKGRIELGMDTASWLREAIRRTCVALVPVSADIAAESCSVALRHHDPADRLIVATARMAGACLITADAAIHAAAGRIGLRVESP